MTIFTGLLPLYSVVYSMLDEPSRGEMQYNGEPGLFGSQIAPGGPMASRSRLDHMSRDTEQYAKDDERQAS